MPPRRKFDFVKFSQSFSASMKKVLKYNALTVREALVLPCPTALPALQLPLSQELLTRKALIQLGATAFIEAQADQDNPAMEEGGDRRHRQKSPSAESGHRFPIQDLLSVRMDLDKLLDNTASGSSTEPSASLPTPTSEYDPQIHLTVKASKKKAEKIFNFLPERTKEQVQQHRRDRLVLQQAEDGMVSVRQSEMESYNITFAEWSTANLRLLNHLLYTGDLGREEVEYYKASMAWFVTSTTFWWCQTPTRNGVIHWITCCTPCDFWGSQ